MKKTHLIFSIMMRNGLAYVEAACGYALGGRLDMLPIYKNKQKHWIWCKKCQREAGIENGK